MRVLLDTNAFLWWITNDRRLSPRATAVMEQSATLLLLSAASAWEIVIKIQMGRLPLPGSPVRYLSEQMAVNDVQPLAITIDHALAVYELPPLHRDPFDRIIIAQAQIEHLPVVSADQQLSRYDIETIW
jgi:PIN domain nuclease of toxin-antitoxin system